MKRNNGKRFGFEFDRMDWRKSEVARTGVDPEGEAELHEMLAAQKLLDLTREAEEAEKAARAAEAAEEEALKLAAEAKAEAAPGSNPGQA